MTHSELINFLTQPEDFSFTQEVGTRQGPNGVVAKRSVYILEGVDDPPDPFVYDDGNRKYQFQNIRETNDGRIIADELKIL